MLPILTAGYPPVFTRMWKALLLHDVSSCCNIHRP